MKRFALTRLWFALSIGGSRADPWAWMRGTVVDAQEIVPGEVWCVTVRPPSGSDEVYYALEATCEIVGQAPPPPGSDSEGDEDAPLTLRADWSTFVSQSTDGYKSRQSILDRLRWANMEEYERGVSKLWLARIAREGDEGGAKRRVAERYVLASVVANRSGVSNRNWNGD
jgi:hypothetical protein